MDPTTSQILEEVKNRLIAVYRPLCIYLFGSHAWGTPRKDSDLDLMIIVDTSMEKDYKRPLAGITALQGILMPVDILVYTKDEFAQKASHLSTLCHRIQNEGRTLYAAT